MPKTRMWVFETDRYGPTDKKFCIDDPSFIPRVGEFVESTDDGVFGKVQAVKYHYKISSTISLVINLFLEHRQ
jgi:hypothetical protein